MYTFNEYLQNYGHADTEDLQSNLKKQGMSPKLIDRTLEAYQEKYEEECKLCDIEAVYP